MTHFFVLLRGAFPYGTSYHSFGLGAHYGHQYDHDEQEREYGLQHDYLLKRKKRDVISSRSFSGKGTDLGGGYSSPRYGVFFLFKLESGKFLSQYVLIGIFEELVLIRRVIATLSEILLKSNFF